MTALLFFVGLAIGLVLGVAHFGGLWLTAQRLPVTTRPGLWIGASLLGRFAVLAVGLVVLVRLDLALLIGALGGIVAVRVVLTWTVGRPSPAIEEA